MTASVQAGVSGVAIVSGGARGMGAAEARLLVKSGATVIVGDILENEGRALQAELGEACVFTRLDVTVEADWKRAVELAVSRGKLTGLINNAGVFQSRTLLETDLATFENVVRINQIGTFLGMQAVVPAMAANGGGSIVNVSSTAGLRGLPGAMAYTASKWAVRGMSKAAARELGRHNIRVNSIHPGPIETDMLSTRTPEEAEKRLRQVPLRRMGQPDEVANLAVFLLSSQSAYMTGAELAIDGGASI
ncbi:3-alpha-hydroxysteroid dehydrogenase [Afipia sp. P52-10]|jgi:3alpha(or 20beta)-hydroxysteroid dehydrogenase|uniref:SDR family NAD(P)-dependent oxidoreductase n=1 Tax=Afipia sp. P52-10 TaxID=1429916 RepID=UPI0003DF1C11|nr:glucose 1-dehydrogenase [Afipia sp. P52-10]ETR76567.1 3-alpha-hydroxysteroid dehydrogenase [Afipia sp. P52-10]